MSIERDLVVPAVMQRGGQWAVFSADGPGYTLALRGAAGPGAEITVFEREKRGVTHLAKALEAATGATSNVHVHVGSVTQPQDLKEFDGVIAAQVLHDIPLERQQQALALLVTYLRKAGTCSSSRRSRRAGAYAPAIRSTTNPSSILPECSAYAMCGASPLRRLACGVRPTRRSASAPDILIRYWLGVATGTFVGLVMSLMSHSLPTFIITIICDC